MTDSANPRTTRQSRVAAQAPVAASARRRCRHRRCARASKKSIEESERQSAALSAQERTMLSNLLKFGELRVSDVMVPARRHRRGRGRHAAARSRRAVPRGAAFAPPGLSRDARRSHRPRPHQGCARAVSKSAAGRQLPLESAADGAVQARAPVRAALDAAARSAAEDADRAHPSGAGDRRIWRHRRPRLHRGHRSRRSSATSPTSTTRTCSRCARPTTASMSPTRASIWRISSEQTGIDIDARGCRSGDRYAGRPCRFAARPRAAARRDRHPSLRLRIRSAGSRSAAREAPAHARASEARRRSGGRKARVTAGRCCASAISCAACRAGALCWWRSLAGACRPSALRHSISFR